MVSTNNIYTQSDAALGYIVCVIKYYSVVGAYYHYVCMKVLESLAEYAIYFSIWVLVTGVLCHPNEKRCT